MADEQSLLSDKKAQDIAKEVAQQQTEEDLGEVTTQEESLAEAVAEEESHPAQEGQAQEEELVEEEKTQIGAASDQEAQEQEQAEEVAARTIPNEQVALETGIDETEVASDDSAVSSPSTDQASSESSGKWYVVHTYAGHENKVSAALKQRIEAEHLENKIFDILVPTQDKIEIRGGKKEQVKEKIFPGYILVKMILDDTSWLAVRTTPGVTSFVGMGNKPTPIPDAEVFSIVKFMTQGATPTFKDVFLPDDTIKIIDGPFAEFIGKVDTVDKEKGKLRVLVSIFGRETPVELDFLQVQKL